MRDVGSTTEWISVYSFEIAPGPFRARFRLALFCLAIDHEIPYLCRSRSSNLIENFGKSTGKSLMETPKFSTLRSETGRKVFTHTSAPILYSGNSGRARQCPNSS